MKALTVLGFCLVALVLAGCAASPEVYVLDGCNCPRESRPAELELRAPSGEWVAGPHWVGETVESYSIVLPTAQADSRTYTYSEVRLFDRQLADALATKKEVPLRGGFVTLDGASKHVLVNLQTETGPFRRNGRYSFVGTTPIFPER
jgi:hypothetical protein